MARRCKHKPCTTELPPARKCTDIILKKGFCGVECLAEHGREKAQKRREAKNREYVRKGREKLKTLAQHVTDTQGDVNRLVVAEDRHKGCISCENGEVSDAGHYFHKGMKYRTSPLTLDRRNLNGQCQKCNRYKGGGSQHDYREGYIKRHGQAAFDELVEYKASVDRGEVPSLTVEECKEIAAKARKRLKELKRL